MAQSRFNDTLRWGAIAGGSEIRPYRMGCPRIFTNLPESFVTIRADSWADKRETFAYGEVRVSNVGEAARPMQPKAERHALPINIFRRRIYTNH